MYPTHLEKTKDRCLIVRWEDGVEHKIPIRFLRDHCCCAKCTREKEPNDLASESASGQLPVLSLAQTMPLDIDKMVPAGNYAYNIQFSDGHSSGIYTFEFLRYLGERQS
ncbi:MAG: DUF971 domain-containing protein [Planctomycetota bacterium]